MDIQVAGSLRNGNAPILHQPHSLKLELAAEPPSLHSRSPVPLNTLSRCPRNRQQAKQGALDRMERRVHENPDLMTIRRCTVEHPFGTIKRMSGGGRFLTRGLRRVKAEAALSILAFNIIRASNAFGAGALMSRG
ncbi:transposase [Ancylobacter sp. G4_0304]|uniref:transposase n=1 Tax=Ancylobacter sp. G4_0304 TaxID=3114289 RepID=UPI0039C61FF2